MKEPIESPSIDQTSSFPSNSAIFAVGQQKKEFVLAHEIGQGSKCRNCDCPGLDLHFWRKMCKNCKCRMDEHDVQLPNQFDHGQIVVGRLFGLRDQFETQLTTLPSHNLRKVELNEDGNGTDVNQSARSNKSEVQSARTVPTAMYNYKIGDDKENKPTTEYAWVPVPDEVLVEKYMRALPEVDRPIAGSIGEQNRKSRLQFQLPLYDCNVDDARFVNEKDREILGKFVDNIKENVIGVGKVVDLMEARNQLALNGGNESIEDSLQRALGNFNCGLDNCHQCTEQLHEIGVQTDHGKPNDTWHPNCFRCATCSELLVDMIYFYHDKKYYCGRHYADLMYPRCHGCDELIFANEYTYAEDKPWHIEHFACFKCDSTLGGHRYMMMNGQPNCIPCFMEHYAKTCESCQNKISPDEQRLSYKEYHWHSSPDCFSCAKCHLNLVGQRFVLRHPQVFCSSKCKQDFDKS